MHSGSELIERETIRLIFLISRVTQAFLAIQIGYNKGQISEEFLSDAKEQIHEMLGSEHARHWAKKYLNRQHPNLQNSEIFASLLPSIGAGGE